MNKRPTGATVALPFSYRLLAGLAVSVLAVEVIGPPVATLGLLLWPWLQELALR